MVQVAAEHTDSARSQQDQLGRRLVRRRCEGTDELKCGTHAPALGTIELRTALARHRGEAESVQHRARVDDQGPRQPGQIFAVGRPNGEVPDLVLAEAVAGAHGDHLRAGQGESPAQRFRLPGGEDQPRAGGAQLGIEMGNGQRMLTPGRQVGPLVAVAVAGRPGRAAGPAAIRFRLDPVTLPLERIAGQLHPPARAAMQRSPVDARAGLP